MFIRFLTNTVVPLTEYDDKTSKVKDSFRAKFKKGQRLKVALLSENSKFAAFLFADETAGRVPKVNFEICK